MNRLRFTFILSLGIHVLIIFSLAFIIRFDRALEMYRLDVVLEFAEPTETTVTAEVSQPDNVPSEQPFSPAPPLEEKPLEFPALADSLLAQSDSRQDSVIQPSAFAILSGNTADLQEQAVRRSLLYHQLKEEIQHKADSIRYQREVVNYNLSQMLLKPDEIRRGGSKDRIGEAQRAKNLGSNPGLFSLSGLAATVAQQVSNFLNSGNPKIKREMIQNPPTLLEISILKQLWKTNRERDFELYSRLDTTLRVTHPQFNLVLEAMTQKGWLKREKVSPQNLFTLMTPLGAKQIEVSPLNRKNPVFEYQPLVSKADVLTALDIVLHNIQDPNRTPSDSLTANQSKARQLLKKRIHKLLEE